MREKMRGGERREKRVKKKGLKIRRKVGEGRRKEREEMEDRKEGMNERRMERKTGKRQDTNRGREDVEFKKRERAGGKGGGIRTTEEDQYS